MRRDPRKMIGYTLEGLKILDAHRSPETEAIRVKLGLCGLAYKHEGVVIDDLGQALREIGHKPWFVVSIDDHGVGMGDHLITQEVCDTIQRLVQRSVEIVLAQHAEYAEVSLDKIAADLAAAQLAEEPAAVLVGGF